MGEPCGALMTETADVLNPEVVILMLVAVQRGNLGMSVSQIMHKLPSTFMANGNNDEWLAHMPIGSIFLIRTYNLICHVTCHIYLFGCNSLIRNDTCCTSC